MLPDHWDELGALGPFFAVRSHAANTAPSGPWRPMLGLVEDRTVLLGWVARVRGGLAAGAGRAPDGVELRVAGSVAQLGLVARLVAPALAAAALFGEVLDVSLANTRWQPELGGPFPLSIGREPAGGREPSAQREPAARREPSAQREPAARREPPARREPAGPPELAARFAEQVLAGPVAELVGSVCTACSLSPLIGWDNVASALNGAAGLLGQARPAAAAGISELTGAILGQPPLSIADPVVGRDFRRYSCCLIYRARPTGRRAVCGDCVLSSRPRPA